MKISLSLLKRYIDVSLQPSEIAALLTSIGLEVESTEDYTTIPGGLKGFVIGEVKTCSKHPNADKLSLTTVDVGGKILNIVCGAPNVAAGQKVVVATVGTEIHSPKGTFRIEKAKIRGEVSEGMICAEDEMGIGTSHAGILVLPDEAPVGLPASEWFGVYNDVVFEIGLTPNRSDAMSHFGVARDLAAVLNARFPEKLKHKAVLPSVDAFRVREHSLIIPVFIENQQACHRYAGVTLRNVRIAESPDWLKNSLKAIGLNPINNVVDITNFVMFETGQPLHAFDAAKIKGNKVIVRNYPEGTKFVTLDGVERSLSAEDLMICNAEEPMCIAGVFGGLHSGITETTTDVFLESACFNPVSVRKTSKRHDLKTDSSFRFERGSDVEMVIYALKRAALLIEEIAGGIISSDIVDVYPEKLPQKTVELNIDRIAGFIGYAIEKERMLSILNDLDFQILQDNGKNLTVSVPYYRTDVYRECDVVEEILRIYGYNNIPFPEKILTSIAAFPKPDKEKLQNIVSDLLCNNGFTEIWNNSLTNSAYIEKFNPAAANNNVKILNPLSSELSVMRQTLLFGNLETLQYNINRKNNNLKLFEFGKVYCKTMKENLQNSLDNYSENSAFSMIVTGDVFTRNWQTGGQKVSFLYLKHFVENVLHRLGFKSIVLSPVSHPLMQQAFSITTSNKEIGIMGMVSKKITKYFDIAQEVFFAEMQWDAIVSLVSAKVKPYEEICKFPAVERDIALIIDESVKYSDIEQLVLKTNKELIQKVSLFDVYQGEKLEKGKKSYAISLTLQNKEKTMTDEEINSIMNSVMDRLIDGLHARIPGYKDNLN